jgi:excisionase family DNA binding protein
LAVKSPDGDNWLSTGQVAKKLGVSTRTVIRYAEAGKLSYVRTIGNQRRFSEREIDRVTQSLAHERDIPETDE